MNLHPTVHRWFDTTHGTFTEAQERCLPLIRRSDSVLLSSPTGTGKTLAAFLAIIDDLVRRHESDDLTQGVHAIYVSPLRALAYDIQKNLNAPLQGMGLAGVIRVGTRTGDTSARDRAALKRRPPHILLTTPESLAVLLAQAAYTPMLAGCRYVIVDELHAFAGNKRGSHLTVSLERLEQLTEEPLCRIGLSATAAPLEELGRFLMGEGRSCTIVEVRGRQRSLIDVLTPIREEPYPPAGWTGTRVLEDMARLVKGKQSVIIFTNTRSGAETVAMRLKRFLPELAHRIETHHSSLDRDLRLEVEDRLKHGELAAVVCSTSLELGVDIGAVDLVMMVATPKGISRTLQRIGRSGHSVHQTSHGVLVATNINDLIECAVCAEMARRYRLDAVRIPELAMDVAVQHLMGMACAAPVSRETMWETLTRAYPFRRLTKEAFDRLLGYLEGGGRSLEGRYRDTFGKLTKNTDGLYEPVSARARRDYLVNIGTIHSEGVVRVILGRKTLGTVEESFLKRLRLGDTFVLAGRVVELVEAGVTEARVKASRARLPTIPRWGANKMPLSSGLAREVSRLRTAIDEHLNRKDASRGELSDALVEQWSLSKVNAEAIVRHFEHQRRLSAIPTTRRFLIECYRQTDERERPLLNYFFHSLIGRSANDALSRVIAFRVKDAVGGNALVTIDDYGFLLTVQPFQEMELEAWRLLFSPEDVPRDLRRALKDSLLVKWQFRGVAQTGLMVPRQLPGKERRLKELRWSAEILFRVLEEHEPDHPLLEQAYREAEHTFLDADRAQSFLAEDLPEMTWDLREVPVVTPFAFGLYASRIKESMMMEDPDEAIERLFRQMQAHESERSRNA